MGSAAGRAALGQQIVKEREAAKEALSNTVATLQRSMLALKKETRKKIAKTNKRVDAYAAALTKEAKDVDSLMKTQMSNLLSGINAQRKAASSAISAANAASAAGFNRGMKEVEAALKKAQEDSTKKFGKMYEDMGKQRAAIDKNLASRTTAMNDGIAKAAALADSRFSKTVKDTNAARKEASAQVLGARKDFATKLNSLTSKIKAMETKLVGEVMVVSGDVINNRAIQARVNAAHAAEMNRIEKLMNLQHSESIKARGKLRRVLDENKRAAAEETDELDTLFKGKIAKIRSVMAANARDAAKDLTKATTQMYATESQAAIAASKKDFSSRLQALTNVVAANHKKVEKGLTVLTGIIRDEKKMAAADRALIREQNKAMGDDMQKKIVQAVQLGEAKAKAVASQARQNLDSTTQSMLVQITNTVEKYADMAFKTIQGDHQKIADNYLSLKAYAVTANDK